MDQRKTVSTLNYATTAIVAASTGMVLARPEVSLTRRESIYSPSSSPLNSRYSSSSPISSREHSPYSDNRAHISSPPHDNDGSPLAQTTGWINNSPQKKGSVVWGGMDSPLSSESVSSPTASSGRKPHKLKRRKSSSKGTATPPAATFFGWRSKSKSPPIDEKQPSSSPVMINHNEHYHLYDIGTTQHGSSRPPNPRQSLASITSVTGNNSRTPLKRIYPPPQKKDSPRLISPSALCQVQVCSGTPTKEQLLMKTLRRMGSDGELSPTRSNGHRRNQSVPSFDSTNPNSPSRGAQGRNHWAYGTPLREKEDPTVWMVHDTPQQDEDKFGSQARRRLQFDSGHVRQVSNGSAYGQRVSSQSPPPTIPERCDSLNWDSESDPTYESMKTEQSSASRKARISSLFDDSDFDKVSIPEHKSPKTVVTLLPRKEYDEDLDWGDDTFSISKGHPNLTRRLPRSSDVDILDIPARKSSLSRSKSVPPSRPDASPERKAKRLSGIPPFHEVLIVAPKECWDNDFEDSGEDMWMIPENITDAQDKLKGYLSNIRTFSSLIELLKRFRQLHPRTHPRSIDQEQLLDEIDAMIEISTLDGFTPPPFQGPPSSPKKSTPSLASSQWSFEERFGQVSINDNDTVRSPTAPTAMVSHLDNTLSEKDLQARRLLEKILGESNELRMEVKPEQLTRMIEYVNGLKKRCDEFEALEAQREERAVPAGLAFFV